MFDVQVFKRVTATRFAQQPQAAKTSWRCFIS